MNTIFYTHPDESSLLVSPFISVSNSTLLCLNFWYHMFGDESILVGELAVYLDKSNNSENNIIKIWSRAGRQQNDAKKWLNAQVNINVSSNFRLIFKAQRLNDFFGDIGLDDIKVDYGACSNPDQQQSI